ncbi:hypothetical protein [Methyloterricola oryzae]|uniref:hypothetical protein n=1 Tax=Methyloterricola oryzae TaxID=1495050 RepID=UPI0005EB2B3B|nr:hypothetical protein [Methyloterricola oryzae]
MIASHVQRHYPGAITEIDFVERLRTEVKKHGVDLTKLLLATSICADDIIPMRESETPLAKAKSRLKKDFLGPFAMGGLAGLPYSGLTGIQALAHHVPDGGSVLFVYGPHIGISAEGTLGKLQRPGQHKETGACGALHVAVEHLRSSADYRPPHDDDDTEQMTLERRLLPFRERILAAESPLKEATEVAYAVIHELIQRYVRSKRTEFHCEYVATAGGIIINTGPDSEDYVDLRHLDVRRLSEL